MVLDVNQEKRIKENKSYSGMKHSFGKDNDDQSETKNKRIRTVDNEEETPPNSSALQSL